MPLHVSRQIESLLTDVAFERLHARMLAGVGLEVPGLREALPTDIAHIRFLASMETCVVREMPRLRETLATNIALERLVPRVLARVN